VPILLKLRVKHVHLCFRDQNYTSNYFHELLFWWERFNPHICSTMLHNFNLFSLKCTILFHFEVIVEISWNANILSLSLCANIVYCEWLKFPFLLWLLPEHFYLYFYPYFNSVFYPTNKASTFPSESFELNASSLFQVELKFWMILIV